MDSATELDRTPLFARLDAEEREALRRITGVEEHEARSVLFREGETADRFYLLLEGLVRIYKLSPQGREFTLHMVRPGHLFAEAAVFGGGGFPASAMALEPVRVARFPREGFLRVLEEHPAVALKIIVSLSGWLRELVRRLEDVSLKEVPERLAGFLLEERQRQGNDTVVLEFSKAHLATRLGTTGETLSRSLRKLREAGILEVRGNRVTILDPDRLAGSDGDDPHGG